MNLNIKGKRALVCGSTQGISSAIAMELAAYGAQVTLLARNEKKLQAVCAELDGDGHDYLVADFAEPENVRHVVSKKIEEHTYHILINNTGGPSPGALISADLADFEQNFKKHLHVSHTLVQLLRSGMKSANYGRIINIISTSVKVPIPGLGVSNTIRGAMASWSKTLSLELAADGITVNNILPGFIHTGRLDSIIASRSATSRKSQESVKMEMEASVPLGRFGTVEEVAAYALLLASPSGAYINGTSLRIDGGSTGSI